MRTWFDEMELGERVELGSHHFTAEDIVRFASSFDPQPFHLTEEGAAATHFGRLCASGWHTASAFMRRLILTMQELDAATIARGETPVERGPSPGFENLKWIKPVFAGDTITYASVVIAKDDIPQRPDWGVLRGRNEGTNQNGELVFSFESKVYLRRRPQQA